jgi:hypothetical protein
VIRPSKIVPLALGAAPSAISGTLDRDGTLRISVFARTRSVRARTECRPSTMLALDSAACLAILDGGTVGPDNVLVVVDRSRRPLSAAIKGDPDVPDIAIQWASGRPAADALAAVLHAVSTDDTRTGINGALVAGGRVAATDGHRIAFVRAAGIGDADDRTRIVPRGVVAAIAKAPDAFVRCGAAGDRFVADFGAWSVSLPRDQGEFPDFRRVVVPEEQIAVRATLDVAEMPTLPRSTVCEPLVLDVSKHGTRWSWSVDGATGEGEFRGNADGALRVGMNPKYLRDVARFLGDTVAAGFTDALGPAMFAGTDPRRLAIVMPMRLE